MNRSNVLVVFEGIFAADQFRAVQKAEEMCGRMQSLNSSGKTEIVYSVEEAESKIKDDFGTIVFLSTIFLQEADELKKRYPRVRVIVLVSRGLHPNDRPQLIPREIAESEVNLREYLSFF